MEIEQTVLNFSQSIREYLLFQLEYRDCHYVGLLLSFFYPVIVRNNILTYIENPTRLCYNFYF